MLYTYTIYLNNKLNNKKNILLDTLNVRHPHI